MALFFSTIFSLPVKLTKTNNDVWMCQNDLWIAQNASHSFHVEKKCEKKPNQGHASVLTSYYLLYLCSIQFQKTLFLIYKKNIWFREKYLIYQKNIWFTKKIFDLEKNIWFWKKYLILKKKFDLQKRFDFEKNIWFWKKYLIYKKRKSNIFLKSNKSNIFFENQIIFC